MKKKFSRVLGISLLLIGNLLMILVGVLSFWGDFEAMFFDAAIKAQKRLKTLDCPAVITTNEIGTVSASFHNTDDEALTLDVRAFVTDGFITLMTEYYTDVYLEPDEVETVEWYVTADDAAYDRLILVRVHQMKESPLPYRNASCGIVVVNVPFLTGTQFIILTMAMGLVLTSGGIAFWVVNSKPIVWGKRKVFRTLILFSAISFLIAVSGLVGYWLLSMILTVIWLVMGISLIFHSLTKPQNRIVN